MKVKKANCGASVPASKKVKMAVGGMVGKVAKAAANAASGKSRREAMKGKAMDEKGPKKAYKE